MTIDQVNAELRKRGRKPTNKPEAKPTNKPTTKSALQKVSLVRQKRKAAKGAFEVTMKCPGLRK
jgi:hypothetical protein